MLSAISFNLDQSKILSSSKSICRYMRNNFGSNEICVKECRKLNGEKKTMLVTSISSNVFQPLLSKKYFHLSYKNQII